MAPIGRKRSPQRNVEKDQEVPSQGPTALNKSTVRRTLVLAEKDLLYVWGVLAELRSTGGKGKLTAETTRIQPLLAENLVRLSALYRRICDQQRRLVERKPHLKADYFVGRIRALSHYREAVEKCVAVLRTVGDDFAWFWYQNDRELLINHLRHAPTNNYLTRIGGGGEVSLICGTQMIGGRLLLYHGITSILRVGDFSLFDFDTLRIHSLIETKTMGVSNGMANLKLVGYRPGVTDRSARTKSESRRALDLSEVPESERLRRQMSKMEEAFNSRVPDAHATTEGTLHVAQLNSVAMAYLGRRAVTWRKASKGLLFLILPHGRSRGLTSRLLRKQKLQPEEITIPPQEVASTILHPCSNENQLQLYAIEFSGDATWASGLWQGRSSSADLGSHDRQRFGLVAAQSRLLLRKTPRGRV